MIYGPGASKSGIIAVKKCGCQSHYIKVQYDDFDQKRHCTTCPHCGNHLTVNPNGTITLYAKEQQCVCYEIRAYKNVEFMCCSAHLAITDNWYDTYSAKDGNDEGVFNVCPKCYKCYVIKLKISNQCYCLGIIMAPKPITKQNYVAHYVTWCTVHSFKPLQWDILSNIFFGCESDDDFKGTLEALYLIQDEGFNLSFMNDKQINELNSLILKLKIRLELFKRVPSGNNMLLAYALIEEITLKKYAEIQTDLDDKLINKFDKCKSLAVGTKFIAERRVAFDKSLNLFKQFAKIEV